MSVSRDISPVMHENSHVLEVLISSTEENDFSEDEIEHKKIYKRWTRENEDTIKKWQLDIEKSSFVYSELLNKSIKKMNLILATTLLFSITNGLFSALSIALGFLNEKWISLAFTIVILISTSIIAIMQGLLRIYGWDKDIQILSPYVEKLDNTWLNFEIELNLPPKERTNAVDFLRRYDGQYMSLMHQCPSISTEDYIAASHKYQENLFDNYMWAQKFKKSMIKRIEEV